MRDPEEPLRTAYFLALKDKISLNGAKIPVYPVFVPEGRLPPYVVISEITVAEEPAGGVCKFWDCSVLVDVVMKSDTVLLPVSIVSRIGAIVHDLVKKPRLQQSINEHLFAAVDDINDLFYFLPLPDFENLQYNWMVYAHRLELSITQEISITNTSLVNRRQMRFRDRLVESETVNPVPVPEQVEGGFILTEAGYKIRVEK